MTNSFISGRTYKTIASVNRKILVFYTHGSWVENQDINQDIELVGGVSNHMKKIDQTTFFLNRHFWEEV